MINDLAAHLLGRWWIDRDIDHAADDEGAHFSGVGVFRRCDLGVLAYRENGTLTVSRRRLEADRELTYRLVTRSSVDVYFPNRAFFHALDLSSGRDRVRFRCGVDAYFGRFDVISADVFLVAWVARGPNKSYVSRSLLSRLD